jgi:hypothetical protein
MGLVLLIAAAKLALQLVAAPGYGHFGDELYFLACGEHLDWGYTDQPPVIALVAWTVRHTLGTSTFAIRVLPAIAGALLVVLAGLLARELGGGRFAMALSGMATALVGYYLVMHHLFTMNAFEPLFWTGGAYLVVRVVKTGDQRLWLWFGLLAGVGLMNKYSMAVFGLGIVVGLLATPERKAFRHRWIWIGGGLAFLILLPNVIWNIQHDWPFLQMQQDIRESGRNVALSPLAFLGRQVMNANPATLPLWVGGTLFLLFAKSLRPFRVLGWAFVAVTATLILTGGKDYYLAPAFPMVLAAGAVGFEGLTARRGRVPGRILLVTLLAASLVLVPVVVPLLSVERTLAYQKAIGFTPGASEQSHQVNPLIHTLAWQLGWPEMVAAVAQVYDRLPPGEHEKVVILASNYAEAGAIDLLGPELGLPKAVSGHQSYGLWGPGDRSGEVVIVIGRRAEDLAEWCGRVETAAQVFHPHGQPWENGPILVCRDPRVTLQEVWPRLRSW